MNALRRAAQPYVMQIRREWRIVVPIRGKLCPKVSKTAFTTRDAAERCLQSAEGKAMVLRFRERRGAAPLQGTLAA